MEKRLETDSRLNYIKSHDNESKNFFCRRALTAIRNHLVMPELEADLFSINRTGLISNILSSLATIVIRYISEYNEINTTFKNDNESLLVKVFMKDIPMNCLKYECKKRNIKRYNYKFIKSYIKSKAMSLLNYARYLLNVKKYIIETALGSLEEYKIRMRIVREKYLIDKIICCSVNE